jgi:hypothetical protein
MTGRSVALVVFLACLTGCGETDERGGGASDRAQARAVKNSLERFYAELEARDAAAACAHLSPRLRSAYDSGRGRCDRDLIRRVIGPEPPRDVGIGHVSVTGQAATAVASRPEGHGAAERIVRERVRLHKLRRQWRITAITRIDDG